MDRGHDTKRLEYRLITDDYDEELSSSIKGESQGSPGKTIVIGERIVSPLRLPD